MAATLSLVDLVDALRGLAIRYWRWPGGRLALWPPPPEALQDALRAHKLALLDLVDARGDEPPEWARSPGSDGWYSPPDDHQLRLLPEGGYAIRPTPEAWAAILARVASYTEEEKRAICEAVFGVDVETRER